MIEKFLSLQHRVLICAEIRKGVIQKRVERLFGIRPGDREPERPQGADVNGETTLDQRQNFAGDRIR